MNQAKKNSRDQIVQRFDTLVEEGDRLCSQKKPLIFEIDLSARNTTTSWKEATFSRAEVDRFSQEAAQWDASCKFLLEQVFGKENVFSKEFREDGAPISYRLGRLLGAQEAFENDHLFDLKLQIFAEVSKDQLEQAEHFLGKWDTDRGRALAAFLASCTFETSLKELCQRNQIKIGETSSIGEMLGKLTQPLELNALEIDKFKVCNRIRNLNAHGEWEKFSKEDVSRMIKDIRDFLAEYLK